MKIALYCPVREDARTLKLSLEQHSKLEGISDRWYFDDNDDQESSSSRLLAPLEQLFIPREIDRPQYLRKDSGTHEWTGTLMSRMAMIRNIGIDRFLKSDADYLFMIDADLFPHPATAVHLASLKRDIVSEVCWTQWKPHEPYLPNVWDQHNYSFRSFEWILSLRETGNQHKVGGLGAITLFSRRALEHPGVNYSLIPSLASVFPGEDRHFCIRAQAHGLELWADTQYPPFHLYRKTQWDELQEWLQAGSPSSWFKKRWLGQDWARRILAPAA